MYIINYNPYTIYSAHCCGSFVPTQAAHEWTNQLDLPQGWGYAIAGFCHDSHIPCGPASDARDYADSIGPGRTKKSRLWSRCTDQ